MTGDWESAAARARDQTASPKLYRADVDADVNAVHELVSRGEVVFVHDEIEAQLAEIIETRRPDRKWTPSELADAARAHAGDPARYGTWVHYPWSRRLVHVLPEKEFEELRTSRNRNKITRDEQTKLRALRVAVAGLSVGQATAVTLALEGIGNVFHLADFDTLNLSNMNRLRAGVHEIGVNKAVLTAREIYELNPYAVVTVFDAGVTDATLEAFFGTPPIDVLFEECDDLKMKVRLREEARKRRIPVLMETSDRGLFDVERFDLDPERALFHGLAGDLRAEDLAGMTTYEKVPIVLAIIGAKTMSKRMAASLVDIDATLKTWPQLASAVALGGAINADAARRIALGKFEESGRFFVDLEALVSETALRADEYVARTAVAPKKPTEPPIAAARALEPLPANAPIDLATLMEIVRLASLAPSGGNCQPWQFVWRADVLECRVDLARASSFLDFRRHATHLAFGALAENLRLACARHGLGVSTRVFPDPDDPLLAIEVRFGGEASVLGELDQKLASQIELRTTNRRLAKRVEARPEDLMWLARIAGEAGAELHWLTTPDELERAGEMLGLGERVRLLSPVTHRDMMNEIRWTSAEAQRTRDGLELPTLELTPTDAAGVQLISSWSIASAIREVAGGHGLTEASRKAARAASAIGLVTRRGPHRPASYFDGGRAVQRVWLAAQSMSYAFQPMTALLYLFARLGDGGGIGLGAWERSELVALRERFEHLFARVPNGSGVELMMFRLAIADPPSARSMRRRVEDMLTIADTRAACKSA